MLPTNIEFIHSLEPSKCHLCSWNFSGSRFLRPASFPKMPNENPFPALKLLSRGKVRDVYELDEKSLLFVATDRISAFDCIMKSVLDTDLGNSFFNKEIPGKGKLLTQISEFWFRFQPIKDIIPNHFITSNIKEMPEICHQYE